MPTINNSFENLTLERLQEIYDILSTSPPGATVWGSITGTLSAQTDLQSALNAKYNVPIGAISQYIRGDGSLATFPTIPTVTPAALTKTDDTNVTLTLGGTPSTALLQAVSLTLGWTGTLADSRIASASTWNGKQDALVSGTNIKTINGSSVLGSGNLTITGGNKMVFVGNANGAGILNGAYSTIYLGGTPVTMPTPSTQYGSASNQFFPGYPMPAGVASSLRVITRTAQPATNVTYVYIANYEASTKGAEVTIAAGSAAGIFTDDSTTVSYANTERLFVIGRNPNVAGGATSAQITTISFNFTAS